MGPGGEMLQLMFDGKPREALKFYENNTPMLRKAKPAQRLRVNIAASVSLEEFVKAVDDFEVNLPGDPCLALLRIQRCLAAKNRERGLKAIDDFEQVIQGDAYLNVLRAQAHLGAGDLSKARELAVKAAEAEPTLDRAWWTAITAVLGQKDFAATAKLLTATEKALGITIGDLAQVPAYAEFVRSAEYQEWNNDRK
jgi:tetratricopeptide (TPR) repeat protein